MLIDNNSLQNRNMRVLGLDPRELFESLVKTGYFPEANIIPPFIDIDLENEGNTSDHTSKPETIFVEKSNLQWRDFKTVHPENYMHTVEQIYEGIASINKSYLSAEKLISYSSPISFSAQASRSGKQIARWNLMQEQLLTTSSQLRLPILLQVDIQNCYHTLYTHTIEWSLDAVDDKQLGKKLDKSIRRGNSNRTHGLPVGQYTSDILAEVVLSWLDKKIETALSSFECAGYRFKDNYYFLCKSKTDAENTLQKLATELRSAHFAINDDKTLIEPFSNYYSSKWQNDYDYLLQSLALQDVEKKVFTNKKLRVFIQEIINISESQSNSKAVIEKAISLLAESEFHPHINNKWLFYSLSNMLPLRSLSYPKLLSFMKLIAIEKYPNLRQDYEIFIKSELQRASSKKDIFSLLWIGYILNDTKNNDLKNESIVTLESLKDENIYINELLKYIKTDTSNPILWKDNNSKLQFKHSTYMKPGELVEYLGVSFAES